MSSNPQPNQSATTPAVGGIDLGLEVVIIPVGDVERAKAFYSGLGWRLDADISAGNGFRVVQFNPPGSACSIQFGTRVTAAPPGSAGLYLVVADLEAARAALMAGGADVSAVFHAGEPGAQFPFADGEGRQPGPDPDHGSYRSFVTFRDPDGNSWLVQEITARLPGRLDAAPTRYDSASVLASALRRAEAAHGEHERRTGKPDPDWPDWYAEFMVREQTGEEPPT